MKNNEIVFVSGEEGKGFSIEFIREYNIEVLDIFFLNYPVLQPTLSYKANR